MTELKPEETLEAILSVLLDIRDLLDGEELPKLGSIEETTFMGLMSDGGLTVPKAEIRTYGDPTILSGNEEGLK